MGNALLIAAGGGGDAISAAALGPVLGLTDEHPTVMTYAWDRLLIDPLPGPRSAEDFAGLDELAPVVLQITPDTRPIPPAGSTLPRLAAELPARLLLLDPNGGAVGMSEQITAAAEHVGADSLAVIDVGGDAMTDGRDEGLRSPLADLLAIAAASLTKLPAQLVILGPGLDGELAPNIVVDRIRRLGGREIARLGTGSLKDLSSLFAWHPSEASGLLVLASQGVRGTVEVRDAGYSIEINDDSTSVYSIPLDVVAQARVGAALRSTNSLPMAEAVCAELTGISEISYETLKAQRLAEKFSRRPVMADLEMIDKWAEEARSRGADFITLRRLSELVGCKSVRHLAILRELLQRERRNQYFPPVYRVAASSS